MIKKDNKKFICINGSTDIFFLAIFAALLIFQIITVIGYAPKDAVVFKNVNVATYVYENRKLTAGSPLMNLYGLVSIPVKVHPLKLIFTILPTPILILYYLGYYRFLRLLFDGGREVMPSMCFVALINIWGYRCEKLTSFSLLMSWFSDAAFVFHGLFIIAGILIAKYSSKVMQKKEEKENSPTGAGLSDTEDEDYLEEWDMKKHKIINARNLAIAMGVMVVVLASVTMVLNKKINDLYAATVNLQTDLNSRCSVYEFAPDGKEAEGYLLKGSDGSLTFIGGGDGANSGELSEFLGKHGTKITNWYVYSENEEDMGAFAAILESSSFDIENVFILDRKDIDLP